MKKLKLLLVMLLALLVTGCGQKDKTMTCTRTLNQDDIKMEFEYSVVYQGDYVKTVKSVEKVIAEDSEILETYKSAAEKLYAPYKKIDYYDTKVTIEGNTLTSTADINYEKIDVDKLTEIDSANKQIFTNGKIKLETIESMYNQVGATCKK